MARPPFPTSLCQFQRQFASEEACQEYLAACRWPEGFACPRCGHRHAYPMVKHRRWRCVACRYQASLTSGTILHNTKTPLTLWFWAAYLMTTDKRGVSALLLQRQLGLRRYETAWMMLHSQLQVYLEEFVFRHNRRKQPMAAFQTLLGLGTGRTPTPYRRIRGGRDLVKLLDTADHNI